MTKKKTWLFPKWKSRFLKWRTAATTVPAPPRLLISSVLVASVKNQSMHLPITVGKSVNETVETKALLDLGAGGIFIDQRFIKTHGIKTTPLPKPILVRNVDGTQNK